MGRLFVAGMLGCILMALYMVGDLLQPYLEAYFHQKLSPAWRKWARISPIQVVSVLGLLVIAWTVSVIPWDHLTPCNKGTTPTKLASSPLPSCGCG